MAREINVDARPERKGQWLRWALSGPMSSGKTYTALLLAERLGNRTLMIETELAGPETGASELFAARFPTFTPFLWAPPFAPDELGETITKYSARFDTIIVDSASHFWQDEGGTMQIVDEAAARMGGNSWAGWAEGTPVQNKMISALQHARCHVIFCMRSKVEWEQRPGRNGKPQPIAVGTAVIQRPGFEYEFALGTVLDQQHRMTITKSRIDTDGWLLEVGDEFEPVRDPEAGPALNERFVSQVLGWLGSATEQARMADPEVVAEILALFESVEDKVVRGRLKIEFVERFGKPQRLQDDRDREALAWVKAQVFPRGAEPEEAAGDGPDDSGVDDDGHESEATEAAGEVAKKAKPAKKATTRPRKATTAAPKPVAAPNPDPPADTAPDGGDAQEGGEPLSEEAVSKAKGVLTRYLVSVTSEWADRLEAALDDAGLWPIGEISTKAGLDQAADVMFPILAEAKKAGAMREAKG